MRDPRQTFARTAARLVEEDLSVALVYAEISGQYFGDVQRRHPDRVINVGIREQLLVNVGAGLALTGMRPVVHLRLVPGGAGVRAGEARLQPPGRRRRAGRGGGSYDVSGGGRTHQVPGDVALMDTPARLDRAVPARRRRSRPRRRSRSPGPGATTCASCRRSTRRRTPVRPGRFHVVRRGSGPTVVAVGPMLSATLAATEGLDATVLYANVVRPFDRRTLRAVVGPEPGGARGALPGGHVVAAGQRHVRRRAAPAAGARGAGRGCGATAGRRTTSPLTASTRQACGGRSRGSRGRSGHW